MYRYIPRIGRVPKIVRMVFAMVRRWGEVQMMKDWEGVRGARGGGTGAKGFGMLGARERCSCVR